MIFQKEFRLFILTILKKRCAYKKDGHQSYKQIELLISFNE